MSLPPGAQPSLLDSEDLRAPKETLVRTPVVPDRRLPVGSQESLRREGYGRVERIGPDVSSSPPVDREGRGPDEDEKRSSPLRLRATDPHNIIEEEIYGSRT